MNLSLFPSDRDTIFNTLMFWVSEQICKSQCNSVKWAVRKSCVYMQVLLHDPRVHPDASSTVVMSAPGFSTFVAMQKFVVGTSDVNSKCFASKMHPYYVPEKVNSSREIRSHWDNFEHLVLFHIYVQSSWFHLHICIYCQFQLEKYSSLLIDDRFYPNTNNKCQGLS